MADQLMSQASLNRFSVIHQITLLQMQSISFSKKYFLLKKIFPLVCF